MRLHPQLEETLLIRTQRQIIDQPPLLPPPKNGEVHKRSIGITNYEINID